MNHDVLRGGLLAICMLVSFTGLGAILCRWAKIEKNISISFAAGYSLYGLLFYFLCFFINTPGLLLIALILFPGFICALVALAGWLNLKNLGVKISNSISFISDNKLVAAGVFTAFVLFLFLLIHACTPAKLYDAMEGYLETSRWIYFHGFKTFDHYDTKCALMPAFTESVYSLSYVFGNEYGAKIFEGFVSLFLLILIYTFSRKRLSVETSVIITISFFCLDEFQWLIGAGKIDMVSQTIYISSLYLLFEGAFKDEKVKVFNIYFSIFFLLIAMASKYTNYIFVPLHVMVLSYYLSTKKINLKTFIRFAVFGILAFLIVVAPHFIRNYYLNGNPFSPIPNPWFSDRMPIKSIELNDENYIFNYYPIKNYILFPYYFFANRTVNSHSSLALFPMTLLFAIGLCFVYIKRFKLKENMPFLFVFAQFVIWLCIFNKYWLVERYIFGLLFLLFFYIFSVLDKVPISDFAKKLCLTFLIIYCGLFIYGDIKYVHDFKFIIDKESLSTWQETQNGMRK